ncbi:shTK domain protein [Oesophagostomum dentatum]|uniref:ShTK domain protein n=1 Tax=Oesophagostomum dentatum TaxID=61180 RepID=A0A0B1S9Z2_OESDE|nr:shTK domain protein [Oesophagostomum dentatum]
MLVQLLAVLLILNVFTHGIVTGANKPCKDELQSSICEKVKNHGQCSDPKTIEAMKRKCAKTCEFCK